ncbi:LysR family transcriptional regulator [Ideonella dechloratans]|uniref:LysR family transcriptional regulator n=1 Tax=Ideonella dechloratans TaxID=36863 RepID=UPI0035B2F1C5
MRNLSLDQLQTLVAIADLGTLAAAAQALHLAPPTVSLHIHELEARLGMALLLRDRKGARPTPAGLALVEDARRLLRELDEAVARARRVAEGRAGKVRLGTSSGVVVHQLPDVLARLARHSPDVEVELSILGSQQTLERLLAGQLELGIVALPLPPQGELVIRPWRDDAMMAWLPAGWTVPDVVTPAWLAERPLVANDGSTQMHRLTAAWFAQAGHHPRARIELNYTEAMKSLVAAGYGAAVLPLERGEDTPLPPGVVVRPLAPPLVRRLGLAHRPPALLDAPTRAVLQLLTPG